MDFELQPTLVGQLVELRPLTEEDFSALYAAASDPLVWEQHPNRDRYKEDVFKDFFRGAMDSGGAFAVIDRADGKMIGSTRYFGYDAETSEIEIGWTFLARSLWGGKYNGEMKRLMLDHAFAFVDSVVFLIGPTNLRSQLAIQKIGAIRDGSRLNALGRDSLVFRISKESWR